MATHINSRPLKTAFAEQRHPSFRPVSPLRYAPPLAR